MFRNIKEWLRYNQRFQAAWGTYKAKRFQREFNQRVCYYTDKAAKLNAVHSTPGVIQSIREHLRCRGVSVKRRTIGNIHTFAFIPMISWHKSLLNELEQLGQVSLF